MRPVKAGKKIKLENQARRLGFELGTTVKRIGALQGSEGGFDGKLVYPEFTVDVKFQEEEAGDPNDTDTSCQGVGQSKIPEA